MADRNADETTLAKPNYLFLPSSSLEAYKMSGNNIVHKALEKVGKSLSAHRAPNRAIFFLYGLSGAGKSSTLNHLFDNKTSVSISHNVSGTPNVVEYVGTMRSEHWCAENLEISFIDAPGFNDTGGKHQDAENFATIELFIQQHQHLGFHDLGKYLSILSSSAIFYPNIVLIVVDANDERLFGYDTDIGKMLRMLARKRLRIVDVKRPNVVFVMTHVCGIAKGHWKTKLEPKANFLQLLGKRFLKIHAPVVFIDNDYEAWDLPKDGDWTVLHNGESQPLNLYKKCIEVMRLNNDEVGIEATRIYYEQAREIPLVPSGSVKGILYTGKEGDELSQEAVYWFNKVSSSFKELKTTNVDLEIDAFIEREKAQRDYLLELYPLKYILKERKLTEVKNIASITLPDIENILTPYRLSDLEKQVICKVFNPIEPTPKLVAPMLGCGFNIFEDTILRPVIDTSQTHQLPPYNFIIPEGCRVVDCVNTETICQGFTDFSEFVMETLIKISAEKYHKFANFPLISGYNIIDSKSLPQDDCKISFRIDQTAFLVCLDSGPLRLDLSKKAENLPETFEQDSETNVLEFSNFFKEYGYWVITQATLGGYIEGVLSVDRANALRTDYYTKIRKLVVTHIANTINGAKISETLDSSVDLAEDEQIYQQLLKAELVWKGGNPRYHTSPLGKLTSYSWEAWTKSLKLNPTILQHSLIPIPLHSILHSHNHTRAMAIQNAYGHLTDDIVLSKAKAKSALPPPKTRSEASEQSKSEIKDDSCFPGSATVLLDSGRLVCMRDVSQLVECV